MTYNCKSLQSIKNLTNFWTLPFWLAILMVYLHDNHSHYSLPPPTPQQLNYSVAIKQNPCVGTHMGTQCTGFWVE